MKGEEVRAVLEALLFVAEGPVETENLAAVLPEDARSLAGPALEELQRSCEKEGRGIRLVRIAGGWRLQTRPELFTWVSEFLKVRRKERLSRQALETLAVITYRQPVTAPEIAEIRGVDPTAAVRTLLDRGLVRITGRKKVVGKPFLYGTTGLFLEEFGLDSLDDLPDLKEFEDLLEERYQEPQKALFEEESLGAEAAPLEQGQTAPQKNDGDGEHDTDTASAASGAEATVTREPDQAEEEEATGTGPAEAGRAKAASSLEPPGAAEAERGNPREHDGGELTKPEKADDDAEATGEETTKAQQLETGEADPERQGTGRGPEEA